MPCNPIQGQGQGHGGLKYLKMADSKGYILRQYACNQKMVNYDTPRQYLYFLSGKIFYIHPRSATHNLQT